MPDRAKAKAEEANNPRWAKVLLARHPARPHALDFIRALCEDFVELQGDRRFGDDAALVGGPAKFQGRAVMVIGHQKGRDTKENIARNFGMPVPEGYRKALRFFQHAEKFGMPLLTFIDTPGAYPGKEGEERGIAMAIAENILAMCKLRVPIVSVVTGEGGSGGALAIGVADRLLMLENSTYSVASPEASAAILWRDAVHAPAAAEAMRITAADVYEADIADEIVTEPVGGAHNDVPALMDTLRTRLASILTELDERYINHGEPGIEALLLARYNKYRNIGEWEELSSNEFSNFSQIN